MKREGPAYQNKELRATKSEEPFPKSGERSRKSKLEVVLKCDSMGSEEAVVANLNAWKNSQVDLRIIQAGVGSVAKSDLDMALTGSRLVLGLNVGIMPRIRQLSQEKGIEVRLYDVIYKLTHDLHEIARSMVSLDEAQEKKKITGKAEVIALFKSSRKGIIIGCEVLEGLLSLGNSFRVISAMGPVYTGKILSLHIENDAVKEAKAGQKVGLKIPDFKKAKIGDLVECFEKSKPRRIPSWQPKGGVFQFQS